MLQKKTIPVVINAIFLFIIQDLEEGLHEKVSLTEKNNGSFESYKQVKNAQSNRRDKNYDGYIEALEVEANKKDANNKRLFEEALSHIALLIKEKEDLQEIINDLKKKTWKYQTFEFKLAFQKEATQKFFGKLKRLNSYGPYLKFVLLVNGN
ncbi:hypothetical protein BD770DRAFT_405684 [Pilaira anomala]|nr:hypothetical protein BD770DRAFT_405684 [Pilaira anomala]